MGHFWECRITEINGAKTFQVTLDHVLSHSAFYNQMVPQKKKSEGFLLFMLHVHTSSVDEWKPE